MSDDHKQWYFIHSGRVFGPLPFHALREATYAGILSAEDEVWNSEGVRGKAGNVDGLPFDSSQATPTGERQARQQAGALAESAAQTPAVPRPVKPGTSTSAPVPVATPDAPAPAEALASRDASPEPSAPMGGPGRQRPPSGKRPVLKLSQVRQDGPGAKASESTSPEDSPVLPESTPGTEVPDASVPVAIPLPDRAPQPEQGAPAPEQASGPVVTPLEEPAPQPATTYQGSYTDWRTPFVFAVALAFVLILGFSLGFDPVYVGVTVLVIITIWSLQSGKRREAKGGGRIALACSVAIMAIAIGRMVFAVFVGVDARDADNIRREFESYTIRHARSAGRVLGEYLAQHHAGSKILIIVDKNRVDTRFAAIQEGLSDGLDRRLKVAGVVRVDVSGAHLKAGERTDRLGRSLSAATFEAPIREYADADLVVSFLPLPSNYPKLIERQKHWGRRVRFALVGASVYGLHDAIPAGLVAAAVVGNPRPRSFQEDTTTPRDYRELFDRHYVLLDDRSISTFVRQYPALFEK